MRLITCITSVFLTSCLFFPAQHLFAQPGTVNMTPVQNLNLDTVTVEVPERFKTTLPGTYTLRLPKGYKARIFYAGGLSKPRFMSFSTAGVLHVSDMISSSGKVYALPDINNDGIADTALVAAGGFSNNHDVKFYNGNMYVTETRTVWKLTDANNDGIYETREPFIDSIAQMAPQPTGGHSTRTIVFDSLNHKAYLSIGSLCNVCREDYRAVIEQYNDNGTGGRIYASGLRNAVGLAIHPQTNRLWANNNGSDRQGDHTPPEWIDLVRDGGFYGYPFAYANQVWFDFNAHPDYSALKPITSADSTKVAKMIEPAGLIQAHSAPMALSFLNSSFAPGLRNGAIMALRGSWNTPQNYKGYKLVYLDLSNSTDTTFNYVADFCSGFITDTINRLFWGRPVGIAVNNRSEIFISSDEGNKFVMQIYYDGPVGLMKEPENITVANVFPNPASENLTLQTEQRVNRPFTFSLFDLNGKALISGQAISPQTQLITAALANGVYMLRLNDGECVKTIKVLIHH